jgi:lysine-specific permease
LFQTPVFSWFNFISSYLTIPVFVALYVGHKLWNKTRLVPLRECNLELE